MAKGCQFRVQRLVQGQHTKGSDGKEHLELRDIERFQEVSKLKHIQCPPQQPCSSSPLSER